MDFRIFQIVPLVSLYAYFLCLLLLKVVDAIADTVACGLVCIAAGGVFAHLSVRSIVKKKHIVDRLFDVAHSVFACFALVESVHYCKLLDRVVAPIIASLYIIFIYTFTMHVKRHIDPYLSLDEYLSIANDKDTMLDDDEDTMHDVTM